MKVSQLEQMMEFQMKATKLPAPQRELLFMPPRRWRFDFAWPEMMIALEVEGGTWTKGRHSRGKGIEADAEKYNAATLLGWRVLRVTGDMVTDGRALRTIESAITGGI